MTNSILIFGGESDIALAVKAAEPSTILIPYEDCDVRVSSEISEHLKSTNPRPLLIAPAFQMCS